MDVSSASPTDSQTALNRLSSQLRIARQKTDALFDLFTPQALYRRAIPERHRVIFYVGHLEAFDWNLLGREVVGRAPVHPKFERLFAFGIDPVDGSLPSDGPSDWPAIEELAKYCAAARADVDACLGPSCEGGPLLTPEGIGAVHMAIEHRLMHLETLAYMLPHLPLDSYVQSRISTKPTDGDRPAPGYDRSGPPGAVRVVEIPAGTATLGRPRGGAFGWDNEFLEHTVAVPSFAIDSRNVTNGEFLNFVQAGGYAEPSLWSAEDWAWKSSQGLSQPLLWQRRGDAYWLRTAFALLPLPLDWPVSVSLAEARAYIRFLRARTSLGQRLPTEAEYHRAAYGTPSGAAERPYPWGDTAPVPLLHGNFGGQRYDFAPVAAFPAGDSAFAVTDLMGNGWEWTGTPFQPFAGFSIDPRYPGYSQPFFDGKHFVMKGASARTDTLFLRRSFRNWFQPHYPYVFATFRCAYDPAGVE